MGYREAYKKLKDEEVELEVLVGWKWKSTNQSSPKLSLPNVTKRLREDLHLTIGEMQRRQNKPVLGGVRQRRQEAISTCCNKGNSTWL